MTKSVGTTTIITIAIAALSMGGLLYFYSKQPINKQTNAGKTDADTDILSILGDTDSTRSSISSDDNERRSSEFSVNSELEKMDRYSEDDKKDQNVKLWGEKNANVNFMAQNYPRENEGKGGKRKKSRRKLRKPKKSKTKRKSSRKNK